VSVLVLKVVFGKIEKGAGGSTRRVLTWNRYGSEYLQGTTKEMGDGHV
jgi:hypothetical protein